MSQAAILKGMNSITSIIIIYNPNSTGDGKKNAETLQQDIAAVSDIPVTLQPTKSAGHAEEIVQTLPATSQTLVISSSGDGGYHEVINGLLRRENGADKLIAGLLPSGNANDHYHAVHDGNIVDRITRADIKTIDVLKVTVGDWSRYAHSYTGIGITPHIGEKLTKATLNPFNEVWLTLRYFFNFRPAKIRVEGKIYRYDSLIFSNIERMSKYLTLSKDARVDDGKFEITGTKAGPISKLLKHLFKASTVGLTADANQAATYTFTSLRPLSLQLDGEVFRFAAGANVTVSIVPKTLRCII